MLDGTSGRYEDRGYEITNGGAAENADWREADRQLRRCARARARLDVEEAGWLLVAWRTDVHRHLGCATFAEYLERVLGYTPRAAADRLRVALSLQRYPRLRDALLEGDIAFTGARALVPVLTPATEAAWIEHLAGKTVREVEQAVSGREPGQLPTEPPASATERKILRFELEPETYALSQQAERALAERLGHAVDHDAFVNAMARALLAEFAGGGEDAGSPYEIAVTVCDHCERGWQGGAADPVELSPAALDAATCDAARLGRIDRDGPGRKTQEPPPRTRRKVLRRDNHRCVVPGCRARRHLAIHHIRHREDGGDHSLENLCTLCSTHHRAHHAGLLSITGTASKLAIAFRDPLRKPRSRDDSPVVCEVTAALVGLGYKRGPARAAIDRALTHVGDDATFEQLLRATLTAAPRADAPEPTAPDPDLVTDACTALCGLGYKRPLAWSAATRGRATLGAAATLPELITAALHLV